MPVLLRAKKQGVVNIAGLNEIVFVDKYKACTPSARSVQSTVGGRRSVMG